MRIVLDTGSSQRELAVDVAAQDVTLGDVLVAAGVAPDRVPEHVEVDGRRTATRDTLEDAVVPDGAVVRLDPIGPPPVVSGPGGRTTLRLVVVAGPATGRAVTLEGEVLVGAGPDSHLRLAGTEVADRHCRVVRDPSGSGALVTELGATTGTWIGGRRARGAHDAVAIGGLVRIGQHVLRLEVDPDDAPGGVDPVRNLGGGRAVPFHRPPRPAAPVGPDAVTVPEPPTPVTAPSGLNLLAVLAPIAVGAVMVVVLGSWRYALFMALSPVLLLAQGVGGARQARRRAAEDQARHEREVVGLATALGVAAEVERTRRWAEVPSVPEVLRRATVPSRRLWERRLDHADALRLHVGVGPAPWDPPLDATGPGDVGDAVRRVLDDWQVLPRSPVAVDLAGGGVIGVVGDRAAALALARSLLLQACVHHGPADVEAAVAVDDGHVDDWAWTSWLPHVRQGDGRRRLAAGAATDGLLAALRQDERAEGGPVRLLVLDGVVRTAADARAVLRGATGPAAGIVVAARPDELPAVCDTVVEVRGSVATMTRPADRLVVTDVLVAGLDVATCRTAARRLAGLADPEVVTGTTTLPARVDLLGLLPHGVGVGTAWDAADPSRLAAPVGVDGDGPVTLDLVSDGPHGLLGGTTGSGKSELLRTLVAGLAATHSPDHCTFVLIDYKGGAAFDACADLPHVVGLVTDLDEHLGERALRCLEAELAHRERRLRASGVSDLVGWLRLPAPDRGDPLPRLLVVVDEFATLKAELPDFVASLVGIAQRGRSLGVHLLLGTQRPAGAVDENVRANANLRIALRMTDDRDSIDVIGVADAAAIPPSLPGRGLVRRGPVAPTAVQTALVTGVSGGDGPRVAVGPVRFASDDGVETGAAAPTTGRTDLERLVDACRDEADRRGLTPPRSPWPPPLPEHLSLEELAAVGVEPVDDVAPVTFALLDEPDEQRQRPVGWDPATGGLLVHGTVGSGTTTTLATVAVTAARGATPDDLHLHVLDLGRGGLAPLAGLPHCGAVVVAREGERRHRLQAWLLDEADRRRALPPGGLATEPLHVLVVDGLHTWLDELDDPATHHLHEAVRRYLVDAAQLRMAVVASAPRPGMLRSAVAGTFAHRVVHRLADQNDLATVGLRPGTVGALPPGRALLAPDGAEVQVARVEDLPAAVAAMAATIPAPEREPAPIRGLAERVPVADVAPAVDLADRAWRVPVGVDVVGLAPVTWSLHPGEHALVLGPPGSGRTTTLRALAEVLGDAVDVVWVGSDAPADVTATAADVGGALAAASGRPTVVLVDDGDRHPDPGPALDALHDAPVRVVAAARVDAVQSDYGHWLRRLARSRTGLFLRPTGDVPGDLLGARLPRTPPLAVRPGRGWLVRAGEPTFVQVATP